MQHNLSKTKGEHNLNLINFCLDNGVRYNINSCTAFGQTDEALAMITAALEVGIDVGVDAYPYNAFSTFIGSAVFDHGCLEKGGVSYDAILVCEGKYKGKRCNEEIFNYIRSNEPDDIVVTFVMREDEVIKAIQHPLVMIASDGFIKNRQGHPRAAGTFPRVLGRFVREKNCLDLVTAIKKMTIMQAQRLGLENKGRIKEGYDADITIFNSETIIDKATFEDPVKPPEGIKYVFIRGIEVVEEGISTGKHPGELIKHLNQCRLNTIS